MTAYIRFCSSQQNSGTLLQKLVETNTEFNTFLKQCQAHPRSEVIFLSLENIFFKFKSTLFHVLQ